ncbi:MAG: 60S ribosomal export protein NMD3 [Methanobacteriaceae archaeon]|nr:60S ribosomal export protein NMD3 [Methanobacteriaceae archaeon]
MFCPRCGRSGQDLVEGLCKTCFINDISLLEIPDEIEVIVCAHCGSALRQGKWYDQDSTEEETIYNAIISNITANKCAEDVEIWVEELIVRGSNIKCLVHVQAKVLGEIVKQEYDLNVKLLKNVCPECSKYASGYYEAVIQIRAHNRLPSNKEVEKIDQIISGQIDRLSKKNKMAYVSERIVLKEGIDYYIGSYKVSKKLVNVLKEELGGVVKESPRLMGKDKSTGKELFRIWISFRLPNFHVGDFIKYGNFIGQLISVDGRKIQFRDLDTGQISSIQWRDYGNIEVVAKKEDAEETTLTAKTPTSIQILDPDDYQPVDIDINPETKDIEVGELVLVIKIRDRLYIVMDNDKK